MREKKYHEIHLYDGMAINEMEQNSLNQLLEPLGVRLEMKRASKGVILRIFTKFTNEITGSIEETFVEAGK